MANTVDNTIFKDWKDLLADFKSKVNGTVAQVNEVKEKVEGMKIDILNEIANGQYIRDPQRIVISAPEIIIGNVDKNGNLLSQGGTVVINGGALNLNGVGEGGKIEMRAPYITQKAVDPGLDGQQEIVYEGSQIISQARSIVLDSKSPEHDNDKKGFFLPVADGANGVFINAETDIQIGATKSKVLKDTKIETCKTEKNNTKNALQASLTTLESNMNDSVTRLNALLAQEKALNGDDADLTKTNVLALDELVVSLRDEIPTFFKIMSEYAEKLSQLAEVNRQLFCLDKEKGKQPEAEAFKTNSTETHISLTSENIKIHSADGDGNIRVNDGAGIDIKGNDIKVRSLDKEDKLTEAKDKGRITIQSRNIDISTANLKNPTYENEALKTGEFPLEGTVNILSKAINMDAVDMKQTEPKKFTETALTAGSEVNIRAEKVKVKTISHEGKSVGKFSVNSQKISLKSTDIKDYKAEHEADENGNIKRPDKYVSNSIAADSQMLLLSKDIYLGFKDKKDGFVSTNLNMVATDNIKMFSKKKAVMAVLDDVGGTTKSAVNLNDSNASLIADSSVTMGGDNTKIGGKTTFDGNIEGKDIKAKNVQCDNIKSNNLSDGMIVASQGKKPDVPKTDDINPVKDL